MITTFLLLVQEGGESTSAAPSTGSFWVPMVLIGVVMYFVLIGPERKNRKKREGLLAGLKKGDKVMTTSGIYGAVTQVQADVVTLQVADGVRMRFTRQAVQGLLEEEKGEKPEKPEKSE